MVALQEMRYVLAVLVRHFDFRLADGYKAETWIEQLEDHFTWTHGPLWSIVTPRQP
jgi:cytochrome P450